MRRLLFAFVLCAVMAAGVVTSALASGPLPPGKVKSGQVFDAVCDGVPVILAANQGRGAAQFVDLSGHIVPVVFAFMTVDVTQGFVVEEQSFPQGNGNAHSNQATISCAIVLFDGTASEAFGTDLPPGVLADDEIVVTLDVTAIPKVRGTSTRRPASAGLG